MHMIKDECHFRFKRKIKFALKVLQIKKNLDEMGYCCINNTCSRMCYQEEKKLSMLLHLQIAIFVQKCTNVRFFIDFLLEIYLM